MSVEIVLQLFMVKSLRVSSPKILQVLRVLIESIYVKVLFFVTASCNSDPSVHFAFFSFVTDENFDLTHQGKGILYV